MIAAVVNFSTNEYPFLKTCLDHLKSCADQILITVCDHFYDGIPEDRNALEAIYAEFSEYQFLEFAYDPENNRLYPKNPQFWANLSRMIGWYFADPKSDYLLFLDCDEILDPSRFLPWLHSGAYREWEAMQLACYWYFFKETWQSVRWDDTPVLVNRSSISVDKLFGLLERGEFYTQCLGSKARNVMGLDGLPMIHHYSWVRNKEQMMRKVCSWTHRNERDWAELVEKEFIAPFRGKDFVHGSALQEVQAFATFDLDQKPVPNLKRNSAPKNVRIVNTDEIHKIDLQLRFNLYVN